MPTNLTSWAITQQINARKIPDHLTAAVDGLLPILSQQQRGSAHFPVRELVEIIEVATRLIGTLEASKSNEKAQECAKTWSIVAAVVVIVVAVVVAILALATTSFSLSTGSLMGAAVAGVVFPLNAAGSVLIEFLKCAANRGHPLAEEMAAIMSQVMSALRKFLNSSLAETTSARDTAFGEILNSLEKIERLSKQLHKVDVKWQGDPDSAFQAYKSVTSILNRLTESLWLAKAIASADVEVTVHSLRLFTQTLSDVHITK